MAKARIQGKGKSALATGVVSPSKEYALETIALSDIHADHDWNARSGDWTLDSGDGEESTGFAGLVTSIREQGLRAPIVIRRNPKATGKKYLVVSGFRRFEALCQIHKDDKLATARFFVMPEGTTEAEAREENGRENILRQNLRHSDVAFLAADLAKQGKTQSEIGTRFGFGQTYAGKLIRIMALDPRIVKHWRSAVDPLAIAIMADKVCAKTTKENLDPDASLALYMSYANPEKGVPATPLERALDAAKRNATLLGSLARRFEMDAFEDFDWTTAVSESLICKIKDDGSMDDFVGEIATEAEAAYTAAVNYVEPVKEEKPAKGSKAKGNSPEENADQAARKAEAKASRKAGASKAN